MEPQIAQLASLLGEHDPATLRHAWRVAGLAGRIAAGLGAPPAVCEAAAVAGLLHDVGKLTVPTALINKPDALTRPEARVMEAHAVNGARIVATFAPPAIVHAVAHHHDRVDTSPALPWLTRLVSVADSYDALVSDRPYRRGCSPECAAAEMQRVAGGQLDAGMVEALLASLAVPAFSAR